MSQDKIVGGDNATAIGQLISGRLLARNVAWNVVSLAAPLAVGIVAIPYLIHGMGKERFGLLSIIWMGVGYFSLFDMGLGQALTKLIAEQLGRNKKENLPQIIWTALWLVCGLGFLGMIAGMVAAQPMIHLLKVPPALSVEGVTSFRLLAIGIPFVILTSAQVGVLAAYQRFATIAAVRVLMGLATFLGPVASLQFSPSLVGATGVMVVMRIAAFIAYSFCAAYVSPALKHPSVITHKHIRPLFGFGGWMTAANIIGPLMVYMDRFFIGSLLSMTAVAYYTTSYDMLSRVEVLPQAVMGVLFPAFATALGGDRARLSGLYERSTRATVLLMLPVTAGAFLLAPEILQLWLGSDFRVAATNVVRLLALGWLVNMLARPSSTVLQSAGRPDLAAKAYAVEIIFYVAVLWLLTRKFGILGTAMAWFLRVFADMIIMNEMARRILSDLNPAIMRSYVAMMGFCCLFGLAWLGTALLLRVIVLVFVSSASAVALWRMLKSLRRVERGVDGGVMAAEPSI